ncbi:MAG TPA: type I-C CRISPR-associated protein Cas8c/Csd1 [Accumulibacter sp.]|uniref:type I-C CRISPR-associated protein Cas8c/Csd1 n=1 Tax=Accumulibacter sp. TaxID=2053492 RepID=UPI002879BF6F|nr:type I-C CRISPR-associated protein Cas8c/Csd1 [Accumulibacter sp.]MDS4015611.1 type I-C CRISPR-associated protein Cas8c/Csd1 [Accumulibacter sp.]MDS4053770.1 type I-C CRISPR-associated protein Cas8c/Csd1 [Accumulibacter sp.]HMV05851.1 type I-C CRISPR-associated protein Cas8c/Csd1 [Accumulibacter sp.]HMW64456.1 type I-C CRISPR-associated protein Cas8c/Csd1 [Accumulibacter sp.]HMW80609.1 type I-C CRISPR-associated protein Cas8c/Csd1 [Accumulibacter sp.]
MILQSLYDYYQRKALDPDPARRLPAFGLEEREIPFIIELSADGHPLGITDTRQSEGKRKTARRYLVPQSVKRASGVAANLLCDTAEYALGVDARGKAQRVLEQHAAFRRRLEELPPAALADAGVQAVRAFYAGNGAAALANDPCWPEIVAGNALVTFRLHPQTELVCQRSAVIAGLADESTPAVAGQRVCLITGQPATAARLHTAIKGVWGAQTSGANIVSFNLEAFTSYNKEQGNNAPVGQAAAFAYTTALNHLLDRNSRQRLQLGDASTVFWAQQEDREAEDAFAAIFGQDDPDARSGLIRSLLAAVRSGQFDGGRGDNRFHVLGLAPNAARLSVRFWHAAPLHEIARQIRQWFDDLAIARSADDPEYPSLFRLLTACAVLGKAENIPPRLGGEIMRSIFAGERFPASWLNAAVMRSRAEQRVNYHRAAAIKACLNRQLRFTSSSFPAKELLPVLDLDNDNPAYRLGRLFATLEKIQEEASPGLNATIRERYYGAASSTPVSVFTTLLRLKNHHLAKIEQRGRAVQFERLLGEILGGVAEFPKHLSLPEQGRFALGYYHQRQAFFSKNKPSNETSEGEPA